MNRDRAITGAVDALGELAESVDVAATLEAMAIFLAGMTAGADEMSTQLRADGYVPAATQEAKLSLAFDGLYRHVVDAIETVIPILDKPIPKLRVIKNPPRSRRRRK